MADNWSHYLWQKAIQLEAIKTGYEEIAGFCRLADKRFAEVALALF